MQVAPKRKSTDVQEAVPKKQRVQKEELTAGSSMMAHVMSTLEEIKGIVAAKGTTEEVPEVVLPDPAAPYDVKYHAVRKALPLSTNAGFRNILQDPDGPNCLLWALHLPLNKSVAEEGVSYDTTSTSSALASKVMHLLFSIEYVKKYKMFDARENYTQQPGTAMDGELYEWLQAAMTTITDEFYKNFQMESKFEWTAFLEKLRRVWSWTRSNNSDNRRARRRVKKQ